MHGEAHISGVSPLVTDTPTAIRSVIWGFLISHGLFRLRRPRWFPRGMGTDRSFRSLRGFRSFRSLRVFRSLRSLRSFRSLRSLRGFRSLRSFRRDWEYENEPSARPRGPKGYFYPYLSVSRGRVDPRV